MTQFKYETGKMIDVFDKTIANILKKDARYTEVKEEAPKKTSKRDAKGEDKDAKVQK